MVAILTGSFLLFLVQPMVARMALPRLGGAPAVWNSAMLVYQALLLGGYAYAHALGRVTPRLQAAIHLAVLLIAAIWLPIGLLQTRASSQCPAGDLGALAALRVDRSVVLRDLGPGAVAAALVQCVEQGRGSLCALRGVEFRQLRRADRLSACSSSRAWR